MPLILTLPQLSGPLHLSTLADFTETYAWSITQTPFSQIAPSTCDFIDDDVTLLSLK